MFYPDRHTQHGPLVTIVHGPEEGTPPLFIAAHGRSLTTRPIAWLRLRCFRRHPDPVGRAKSSLREKALVQQGRCGELDARRRAAAGQRPGK